MLEVSFSEAIKPYLKNLFGDTLGTADSYPRATCQKSSLTEIETSDSSCVCSDKELIKIIG